MINQELLNYIRGEIAKGKSLEEIKNVLLSAGGWSNQDLLEAFQSIAPTSVVVENLKASPNLKEDKPNTKKQGCLVIGLKIVGILILFFIIAGGIFYWYAKNKLANYLNLVAENYSFEETSKEDMSAEVNADIANETDLELTKEKTESNISGTQMVSFEDFPDLILSGKDYECSMVMEKKISNQVNLKLITMSYISKTKSSSSMSISIGPLSFNNHNIADGEYLYAWGSATGNNGKKYKLNSEENPELVKSYVDQFKYDYSQLPEGSKVPDLSCQQKSIDPAKFIPPTNIKFILTEVPKTANPLKTF